MVSADALRDVALVASAGLRVLPVESLRGLEGFVQAGGGLVICGPIDPSAGEFTDLLPIAEIVSTIRPAMTPRDGSREFVRAWTRRYQLTVAEDHPVVQGLPFFPERTQDVGTLQVLTPRPGAVTVLRYATPAGLLPEVTSPALVLSDYGAGRVGVLANPVDWGLPGPWCLWSRVGEHHRVFFGRLALWAAEGALAPLRSKPPSSDCRAQELSE